MDARRESEVAMKNRTNVERKSDRELVVTRTFNAPARIVFEAWTKPELFKQWWVPKSMGMFLRSCERSEEHTSELQSQSNLVCRLLLEKKNKSERAISEF